MIFPPIKDNLIGYLGIAAPIGALCGYLFCKIALGIIYNAGSIVNWIGLIKIK